MSTPTNYPESPEGSAPDKCPHCGADTWPGHVRVYRCGVPVAAPLIQTDLCKERAARQKAEAELNAINRRLSGDDSEDCVLCAKIRMDGTSQQCPMCHLCTVESDLELARDVRAETKKELERLKRIAWGAVHNARRDRQGRRCERWIAVRDAIGVGSSTARNLCREFGLDPHEGATDDGSAPFPTTPEAVAEMERTLDLTDVPVPSASEFKSLMETRKELEETQRKLQAALVTVGEQNKKLVAACAQFERLWKLYQQVQIQPPNDQAHLSAPGGRVECNQKEQ